VLIHNSRSRFKGKVLHKEARYMYILGILAIWSHRPIMGSHSAKLRSTVIQCLVLKQRWKLSAEMRVMPALRNTCRGATGRQPWQPLDLHTGRRGSTRSWGRNSKRTLLSYTHLKSCLFFQKGKWAKRCDYKILTETTRTSVGITAGSTQVSDALSDIP